MWIQSLVISNLDEQVRKFIEHASPCGRLDERIRDL